MPTFVLAATNGRSYFDVLTQKNEMVVGKEENNCVAAAAAAAAAKPQSEEVFGKKYVWLPQHC